MLSLQTMSISLDCGGSFYDILGNVPMPRSRKFTDLTLLLQGLPRDVDGVRLTFADLEKLGEGPLPPGAWTSAYWSNSTVARRNWLRYGFAAKLDRHGCVVLFSRCAQASAGLSNGASGSESPATPASAREPVTG
jgi:hypothetical protein